jgi:hypothetical protein
MAGGYAGPSVHQALRRLVRPVLSPPAPYGACGGLGMRRLVVLLGCGLGGPQGTTGACRGMAMAITRARVLYARLHSSPAYQRATYLQRCLQVCAWAMVTGYTGPLGAVYHG